MCDAVVTISEAKMSSEIRRSLRVQSKNHSIKTQPKARRKILRSYGSFDVPLNNCKYKYRGCKERLPVDELKTHESECHFRWYKCEGKIFAGWSCNWKGYHEDIMNHFKKEHRERTYMREQNIIEMSVIFDEDSYDIQLIRKRKQLFWFKHRLLSERKEAYWLCQYVGPQKEALTYCYELVVSDEVRKFAVTELCYTDALDANKIYEAGRCVVMTFDQIKSFMTGEGKVKIYFRIKKNVKAKRMMVIRPF